MKFISWNVNGLRACAGKGFEETFKSLDADFFCLQETKMQPGQLDMEFPGYVSFWNSAEKKGYSGTAVWSKHQPLSVTYGLGIEEHDHEGRIITLEMEDFYLVCVYVPNSQDGLRRLDYRMSWEDAFRGYVKSLVLRGLPSNASEKPLQKNGEMSLFTEYSGMDAGSFAANSRANCYSESSESAAGAGSSSHQVSASNTETGSPKKTAISSVIAETGSTKKTAIAETGSSKKTAISSMKGGPKGVVICGDLNVAHKEIDIKNASTNHHNAGFTDEERDKFSSLLEAGFVDTWRLTHPEEVKYSWWSYRFHARENNAGWRIDYFLVSDNLRDKISGADIHNEIFGSDHCPVELNLDI